MTPPVTAAAGAARERWIDTEATATAGAAADLALETAQGFGLDLLDFELPPELAATAPPEARGLAADEVRLLVSEHEGAVVRHAQFRDLVDFVEPGDVLVVNASATINAALEAWRRPAGAAAEERIALHLSTAAPEGPASRWVVELRRLSDEGSAPLLDARAGEVLRLSPEGSATLLAPYLARWRAGGRAGTRLWVAEIDVEAGVLAHAASHGGPIRYRYVRDAWPLTAYQTMFASDPGSAEMPSAGRPFTPRVVEALERKGARVVPLVLHAGVGSLEADERPYPERYRVPSSTATAVNAARAAAGRVIAVGTTVVRALETVADGRGWVRGGEGRTDLVVTPERGIRAVDAILTGLHEPRSSHLAMLEALVGRTHLARAYRAALDGGYLWHEFGDVHLIRR